MPQRANRTTLPLFGSATIRRAGILCSRCETRTEKRECSLKSIADVDAAHYDAIFVTGGQSPMVTFRDNAGVQSLVAHFYEAGKVTALVCHGTCLLLETRLGGGELLVAGRTWTGFANREGQFADSFVGTRIQPFWIDDEARTIDGTNCVVEQRFGEAGHTVTYGARPARSEA